MGHGNSATTAGVLAGGDSFGASQAGMLRALVAHGVRPDLVVGSSVGALNGAYFCGDPTPAGVARLEAIWHGLKRRGVFPFTLRRIVSMFFELDSLVDSHAVSRLIERHVPYRQLEQASIAVHIAATRLLSGASVLLSFGPAAQAVLASCAIPAAFPPACIGGVDLMDGPIASNTPVIIAVGLGASRLVVLTTGYACALPARPATAIASALHAFNLPIAHQPMRDLEPLAGGVEVATVPPLCPLAVSPYEFSRADELIERAALSTYRLEGGGLGQQRIPAALRPHVD